MNVDRLFALYDRVAEAPDAVGRLRRFVLDLAVRGKLVEQNPTDEPASDLLKRITAAKARLVRIGNIRKPKPSTPIDRTEVPLEVPIHWTWIRLGDIGTLAGGMTPSKNRPEYWDGTVTWLSPKDIRADAVSDSELKITEKALSDTRLKVFPVGSLFMVARSGILKRTFPVAINRVPAASNQDLKVLVPFLKGQERYLQVMFRGLTNFILKDLVKTGTTVQSLKYAEFEVQPIPLPPLAEQHRIVAKVDELLALCDQLEETRTAREDTRDRLTLASLTRLSAPGTDVSTFRSHARFAVDALPALTARADQVKHLRQTILNLAVRGKLVEQDPADEPVPCPDRAIHTNIEPPFPVPSNWRWSRLRALGTLKGGGTPSKARVDFWGGSIPWVSPKEMKRDYIEGAQTQITETALAASAVNVIEPDSVLFVVRGMILAHSFPVAISRVPLTINQDMKAITLKSPEMAEYLLRALKALKPEMLARVQRSSHGTCRIAGADYRDFMVPLPPLAEQRRIVAKVDELMALGEQLEAGLGAADGTRSRLLDSLLHGSLGSHDATINGAIGGVAKVGG